MILVVEMIAGHPRPGGVQTPAVGTMIVVGILVVVEMIAGEGSWTCWTHATDILAEALESKAERQPASTKAIPHDLGRALLRGSYSGLVVCVSLSITHRQTG